MSIFNWNNRRSAPLAAGSPAPQAAATCRAEDDGRFSRPSAGAGGTVPPETAEQNTAARGGAADGAGQGDAQRYIQAFNSRVDEQARAFARKYPAFRMEEEIKNPAFRYYVWSVGLTVEEAYLLAHREEILAMLSKSRKPAAPRVTENAVSRIHAVSSYPDIENMSDDEVDAVLERVRRGERVSFD